MKAPFISAALIALSACSMMQSPQGCQFNAPYATTVTNVTLCGVKGDPSRGGNNTTATPDINVGFNKKPGAL